MSPNDRLKSPAGVAAARMSSNSSSAILRTTSSKRNEMRPLAVLCRALPRFIAAQDAADVLAIDPLAEALASVAPPPTETFTSASATAGAAAAAAPQGPEAMAPNARSAAWHETVAAVEEAVAATDVTAEVADEMNPPMTAPAAAGGFASVYSSSTLDERWSSSSSDERRPSVFLPNSTDALCV